MSIQLKSDFWAFTHQRGKNYLHRPYLWLLRHFSLPQFLVLRLSYFLPYRDRMPVYDARHSALLFHSPKAGGGSALRWFMDAANLLQQAEAQSDWVHHYINGSYYFDHQLFGKLPKLLADSEVLKIKVVRNPYTRFVSSYFHFAKHASVYVEAALPQDFNARDFMDLLERENPEFLNPHFAPQYSRWEELYPNLIDEVVHLENLEVELNGLNERYNFGCPFSPSHVEKRHAIVGKRDYPGEDVSQLPARDLLLAPPINTMDFFLDQAFKQKVYRYFKRDFEAYGYPA